MSALADRREHKEHGTMEISPRKVAQVAMMGRELGRAEGELRAFIEAMTEDEQAELIAIMWIGRGSFESDDLDAAVQMAKEEATTPCADYLIGTPLMSDYLEDGLDALDISAADVEDELM
jgi:hypothetical protein